ncbi:MAG TPA: uridine kinase [Candidatus Agrococcus pullicola]|uniref:Uridine kinase n=1 Tax=Candidatus Agrococcus pullicola TaxID=2838429 RepID=A0A9D2CA15_9MICO|nr:uridine kinase [Candidatus Agrococcus pullicola]
MPSGDPRLIIVGGASGSGKSYIARRFGAPAIELDAFYREIDEDADDPLPRTPYGEIDWDDVGTFRTQHAVDALLRLIAHREVTVPVYDLSISRRSGSRRLRVARGPVIAEGVFASAVVEELRRRSVGCDAWYVIESPTLTMLRRFVRDVREARKPLPFLIRRGLALRRAESRLRQQAQAAGFALTKKSRIKRILRAL